jgi:hypothetical protein
MPDELERLLASNDPLEPSSGFAAGVMAQVRRQAAEPPPLPFPWLRFLVGVSACLLLAGAGAALWLSSGDALLNLVAPLAPVEVAGPELGYAALALAASALLARLPRALVR